MNEAKPLLNSDPNPPPYYGPPGYPTNQQNMPSYMQSPQQPMHSTTIIHEQPTPNIVVVGGCPACKIGVLQDEFTCLGICCAIFFFPLGLLCLLMLRERRCSYCSATFS